MVGAAVGLGTSVGRTLVVGLWTLLIVAVERTEVTNVQAHLFVDVPDSAETETVAVAGERGVLLVAVGESVVSTLAARYEFRTKVNPKNETNVLDAGLGTATIAAMMAADPAGAQAKLGALQTQLGTYTAPYQDGARTRYDMPALLSVAAGYEITPKLRATLEYHFFDDKNAKMANNRQEELSHGTHEILLGAEYDVNDKLTVSLGGQRTDYGLSDGYQQNTSFACDSYSIGVGGAYNLTEKIRLNAGYFISLYSDYDKQASYGKETYSRTNNVIGLGVDFKF